LGKTFFENPIIFFYFRFFLNSTGSAGQFAVSIYI